MGRAARGRCETATNLEKGLSTVDSAEIKAQSAANKRLHRLSSRRLETVCELPAVACNDQDNDDKPPDDSCLLEGCCSGFNAEPEEQTCCCTADEDRHLNLNLSPNIKFKRSMAKKINSRLRKNHSGDNENDFCTTCLKEIFSPINTLDEPSMISNEPNTQTTSKETHTHPNRDDELDEEDQSFGEVYKCEHCALEADKTLDVELKCQQHHLNANGNLTFACSEDYCLNCDCSLAATATVEHIYDPSLYLSPLMPAIKQRQQKFKLLSAAESAGQKERLAAERELYLANAQLAASSTATLELLDDDDDELSTPVAVFDESKSVHYSDKSFHQFEWLHSIEPQTLLLANKQQQQSPDEFVGGNSNSNLNNNNSNSPQTEKKLLTEDDGGDKDQTHKDEGGLLVNNDSTVNEKTEEESENNNNNKENKGEEDQGKHSTSENNNNSNNNKFKEEEELMKSHMDWQNIAKRYGKMPYQHKGHIWWRIRESCFCHILLSTLNFIFPIFTSFKNYSLPGDLFADLMSGFTVAILHIPQGMAYGLLAGVEPIYGLYVSMVPVLIMALMSKSPHMSYGTFAVISILLANSTESIKQALKQQMSASLAASANVPSASGGTNQTTSIEIINQPIEQQTNRIMSNPNLRQHDLSNTNVDPTLQDALVITNNHKSADPAQQLLKNLLMPANNQLDSPSFMHLNDEDQLAASNLWTIPDLSPQQQQQQEFIMPTNIEILTCICLLAGLIQIVMALMRLGILSLMFSDQLVSSFTTASAVHVATSQLGNLFDINVPRVPDGFFKVCRIWWMFGTKLLEGFNHYTAILSLLSLLFLLNVKEIIEPILKRRYKLATCVPSELVLMSVLVICSWFWKFNSVYGINIVGNVPTGLPVAKVPRLDLVPVVIQDALTVAVVSFAMNLSLAQVCAKKFRYKLNPNQELFALGTSNLISSFFNCFPCASSLSRTAVQSNLNAKSQIGSLFSCAIVVSVICYFAPFFYNLPRSTLSCIILVALKGILVQGKDFFENWRRSKLDALVWLATFMFVIAFDVTYGLILGILTSLSMVFYRLLTPNYSILGQLPDTQIYVDKSAFVECHEIENVKIFRFNSALCYLNRDMFKSSIERLLRTSNNNLPKAGLFCRKQQKEHCGSGCNIHRIEYLIIDCSALSYCDFSGASTLVDLIEDLEEQNHITVYLASCPLKLINMIEKLQKSSVLENSIYPSITDAINQTRYLKSCNVRASSYSVSNSSDSSSAEGLESVISVVAK